MAAEYEVEVDQQPFGFYYDGNKVLAVNKRGPANGVIHAHSDVVEVTDKDGNSDKVDASKFQGVYQAAIAKGLPVRLKLTMDSSRAITTTPGSGEVTEISRQTLTGLILVFFSIFMGKSQQFR